MDSEAPETAGEYLRTKREGLGLTREEISLITKIRSHYIEAIENDNFSAFSSPQLLKGYVKLIAKTLKADDKEVLSLLEAGINENFKDKHIEDIVGERFKEERQKSEKLKKKVLIIVLAGFLIIILSYIAIKAVGFYEFVLTKPGIHIVLPFQSSIKSFISKPVPAHNSPKNVKGTAKKVKLAHYAAVLKGKVIKRTWVAVKIDGKNSKTLMLYPGDTEVWKAKKRLDIKIGNAGGIILNYNGKNLGKIGAEKQVVTLNFPPEHSNKGNQ
ncbi:MAG: helix-turn-helix domain-containing protein [bacterium]